jgi:hypothetical protein
MAVRRKDSSRKAAVGEVDQEVLDLLLLKQRIAKRGLWQTVHLIDAALTKMGWEIADKERT